ncbi:MAG: winged helix-turn-helix transcriptional regulator [Candidatus Vogelbacteria bacterium]|nr:winged helix-turn-helix transcriptional regulator [Candidatus Vogelbacteria bacterium]
MDIYSYKSISYTALKILSNSNRLAIMSLLFDAKKDLCVNEIAEAIGISQSLASHQLAYLEARGVIEAHRMGQMICYIPSATPLSKKVARVIESLK